MFIFSLVPIIIAKTIAAIKITNPTVADICIFSFFLYKSWEVRSMTSSWMDSGRRVK